MSAGTAIIAGLIIGWVIEWIIDWRFWRTVSDEEAEVDVDQLQKLLSESQAEVARLRNELAISTETHSNLNEKLVTQTGKDK